MDLAFDTTDEYPTDPLLIDVVGLYPADAAAAAARWTSTIGGESSLDD